MAPLLKRAADPPTGANLFDDRMRKKWTDGLAVLEVNAVKLIDLV